jgi:hypothetical protein
LANDDLPFFGRERAGLAAVRTGSRGAQGVGLLLRGGFQSAGEKATDGGEGDFFHLVEVNVQPRTLLAPVLADDNFAPLFGEIGDALPVGRGELRSGHAASVPGVAKPRCDEIPV